MTQKECMLFIRQEENKIKAAVSEDFRKVYINNLKEAFSSKQIGIFLQRLEEAVCIFCSPELRQDTNHMEKIRTDALFCYFYYGFDFSEYFLYRLEGTNHAHRSTYVTQNRRESWYARFNPKEYQIIMDDKCRTWESYKPFFKRDCCCVRSEADEDCVISFMKENASFFVKDALGYWGKGVRHVQLDASTDYPSFFRSLLSSAPVLIEQPIRQDPRMAALHPNSVNTIRYLTVSDKNKKTFVLDSCLRIGQGSSIIDNHSSGGICCFLDPLTGIVIDTPATKKGQKITHHPDTGILLTGFQVPEWDSLLSLVQKLNSVIPEIRLVGWDLALTPDGWVLVEANQCPELDAQKPGNFGMGFLPLFEAIL